MSARHRIARAKAQAAHMASPPGVPGFANVQQRPRVQEQQLGIEQLIPMLIAQGQIPTYGLAVNKVHKVVQIMTKCGPIAVPLLFEPAQARLLAEQLLDLADQLDPPDDAPIPTNPEAEQLLAELIEATSVPGRLIKLPSTVDERLDTSWQHGAVEAQQSAEQPTCPGCQGDLSDSQVSSVEGQWIDGVYYCHPCQKGVTIAEQGQDTAEESERDTDAEAFAWAIATAEREDAEAAYSE